MDSRRPAGASSVYYYSCQRVKTDYLFPVKGRLLFQPDGRVTHSVRHMVLQVQSRSGYSIGLNRHISANPVSGIKMGVSDRWGWVEFPEFLDTKPLQIRVPKIICPAFLTELP